MNYTLDELSTQVRRDVLRMVHKVNSGHPGGSLGCTEFLVALYSKIMNRKDEPNPAREISNIYMLRVADTLNILISLFWRGTNIFNLRFGTSYRKFTCAF